MDVAEKSWSGPQSCRIFRFMFCLDWKHWCPNWLDGLYGSNWLWHILTLYQINLLLETTQMLQNGITIWTIVWSGIFYTWFVRNILHKFEDLFWFQSYWVMDIIHENFTILLGNYIVVIQTLFINWTRPCHICLRVCLLSYDWFPVVFVNRDGYHMWDRKWSLFRM